MKSFMDKGGRASPMSGGFPLCFFSAFWFLIATCVRESLPSPFFGMRS
jgi:hypothetical protein